MSLVITVDDGAGVKIGDYTVFVAREGKRIKMRMVDVPKEVGIVRVRREPDIWEKLAEERRPEGRKPGGFT